MENQKNSLLREFERRQDALIEKITKIEPGLLIKEIGGLMLNEKGLSYEEVLKVKEEIKKFKKERNSCKIKGEKVILNKKLFTKYLNESKFLLRPVESVLVNKYAHADIDWVLVECAHIYKDADTYVSSALSSIRKRYFRSVCIVFALSFLLLFVSKYFLILSVLLVTLFFFAPKTSNLIIRKKILYEEKMKSGFNEHLWGVLLEGRTGESLVGYQRLCNFDFPYTFEFVNTKLDFKDDLQSLVALTTDKDCKLFFLMHQGITEYKFSPIDGKLKLTVYKDVVFGIEYDDYIVFPFEKQLYDDFSFNKEKSISLYDFFNTENGKVFV
jgi:hypothetical protein